MKLTLTREQIPLARKVAEWVGGPCDMDEVGITDDDIRNFPGHDHWQRGASNQEWAHALEAAITEAEHPMQTITLAKPGDADERAFWREVFTSVHRDSGRNVASACDQADEALARYRAAFCTGMPSDQKGAK